MSEITIKNLRAESRRINEEIKRLSKQKDLIDKLIETLSDDGAVKDVPATAFKRVSTIPRRPTGMLILNLFNSEVTGASFPADAIIRIADLAGYLGLDLDGAIKEKMAYNAKREDHKIENRSAPGGKAF